jgi:cellulose synthase/poly-beta-1,6-N-acetylglucosamine synthase-like glycosyltransferase
MGVDGGMYIMRRSLFRPLRRGLLMDDLENSMAVIARGYKIAYEPRAVATETATPTAKDEFRRRIRVCKGCWLSLLSNPTVLKWPPMELTQFVCHKLLRWVTPLILAILLVTNLVLVLSYWQEPVTDLQPNPNVFENAFSWITAQPAFALYLALLIVQLACYLVALIGALWPKSRHWPAVCVPFYFLLGQVGMLVAFLSVLMKPTTSGTWQPTRRSTIERAKT